MTRKKFIKECMALGTSRNDSRRIAKLGVKFRISYQAMFAVHSAALVASRMIRSVYLATSTDVVLDRHAYKWGLEREENESDDDLRKRIIAIGRCQEERK